MYCSKVYAMLVSEQGNSRTKTVMKNNATTTALERWVVKLTESKRGEYVCRC